MSSSFLQNFSRLRLISSFFSNMKPSAEEHLSLHFITIALPPSWVGRGSNFIQIPCFRQVAWVFVRYVKCVMFSVSQLFARCTNNQDVIQTCDDKYSVRHKSSGTTTLTLKLSLLLLRMYIGLIPNQGTRYEMISM